MFEGLSIWNVKSSEGEYGYRLVQGTYQVVFMSFAKVKAVKYEEMEYAISSIIFDLYQQNRFLLEGDILTENEKNYFQSIKPGMNREVAVDAVNTLTGFLCRYYDKSVIILLDEYDTPMQEAWISGNWEQAVEYFRSFLMLYLRTIHDPL